MTDSPHYQELEPRQLRLVAAPQTQSTKDDYYTPAAIFDALGLRFDLDVCAPPGGVPWIPADRYFTMEDDGLAQPWEGRVWMNPPFSYLRPWVDRFIEHRHGIALVPHSKGPWHVQLWSKADAVAEPLSHHVQFVGGETMFPVWFAAFGPECVAALARVGAVRKRDES